jgi:hypothetical protein
VNAAIGLTILALATIGAARLGILIARALRHVFATLRLAARSSSRARELRQQRECNEALLARMAMRAEAGVLRGSAGCL